VSEIAPPFVGFIELSQISETTRDELLGKMLSGEHPAYVYSSEADGRLEPARITPAEFFKAWRRAQQEAGCDDCLDASGWPLKKMGPFQIRVPDRDIRRDRQRLVRRTIGVPHWIYLLKADLAPSKSKSRAGRKAVFDWPEIRRFTFEQLTARGDFEEPDQTDGWTGAADLYRAIADKFGENCPELTTLKGRVPAFVDEWRAESRKLISDH
jgi:hypothetical protein